MKMVVALYSMVYRTIRRYSPEDSHLQTVFCCVISGFGFVNELRGVRTVTKLCDK
jgi:hypothetical protein